MTEQRGRGQGQGAGLGEESPGFSDDSITQGEREGPQGLGNCHSFTCASVRHCSGEGTSLVVQWFRILLPMQGMRG